MKYLLGALFSLVTLALSFPNPLPGSSSNIIVRDPAIWYNANSKKYFVFSIGGLIKIFTSESLKGPTMENGMWDDLRQVISSKDGDRYNAIDPNLIDADGLKLAFGSYNDWIF
ncbi:hypothetical protein GSI_07201 [Ganoderma sinense ZZ0214-1]|uniref:Uncharacterized protein n=1 Tax=Ganoderma sinense ZZ0214-1 TaxID=1077348 RepID=A0A2G8S9T1_9APHY|nr:hypothetical protein GSI_07201 [Ganoderma sinense ZZ0214-1]